MLDLPEELHQKIGRHALALDLPSALRCRQACTALRDRLGALEAEAQKRRLQWVASMTVPDSDRPHMRYADLIELLNFGRTFKKVAGIEHEFPCFFGTPLPTAGKTAFSVRVDHSPGNAGPVIIGVARADSSLAWGLSLSVGMLVHQKIRRTLRIAVALPCIAVARRDDMHVRKIFIFIRLSKRL